MSAASTWEGPQLFVDEEYPPELLKYLLKDMMTQFNAQGAAIALFDEASKRMRIRLHVRFRSANRQGMSGARPRRTVHLGGEETGATTPTEPTLPVVTNGSHTAIGSMALKPMEYMRSQPLEGNGQVKELSETDGRIQAIPPRPRLSSAQLQPVSALAPLVPLVPPEELDEVPKQRCELFAMGTRYAHGEDLIGMVWKENTAHIIRHDEYVRHFHKGTLPFHMDITPYSYLVVPVLESTLVDDMRGRPRQAQMLGVVVLYQTIPAVTKPFRSEQRVEAVQYAERIALYLQNDKLQRVQRRSTLHLRGIQEISTAFPTNVKLTDLIHKVRTFTEQVVHVSAILITLYDRDTDRIYDVYAHRSDDDRENLVEQPSIKTKNERPTWCAVTQIDRQRLYFSPTLDEEQATLYDELLQGAWGDQHEAQSFLLLPMKMFNRVIGSICITSTHPRAYHEDAIQVLETMVQIITVSLENVKLYERDKFLLHQGKQREWHLAVLNSAYQSMSSGLNVNQLLNSLVDSAAQLMDVELSVFFQPTPDNMHLVAHAMYSPPSNSSFNDGSNLPSISTFDRTIHTDLISKIQIPYKGTILEQSSKETYFYLDAGAIEDLARHSEEGSGGRIFLEETELRQMLMVPVSHDADLMGFLAISAPGEVRHFRPKDVGTLLAVCAQAAGAIRQAQLFMEREEAYAELQRLNMLKDEFLVTASHELRTPLSAINGYAALLKRQNTRISPQNILRYATKIAGAAQQLSDLMANMTEASKIGMIDKKMDLKIGLVELKTAAEIAVGMLVVNVEQELVMDVPTNLWVRGDPLRVRQVMTNLLDNATKYSPAEGTIRLKAVQTTYRAIEEILPEDQKSHLMYHEQEDYPVAMVSVIDQGEGIAPEDQKNIFEKFVRAPRSLTTPVRGTGLGLYISRRYIEAMGGRLWLERSGVNEGSVLSFYLPQVSPEEIPTNPHLDADEFTDQMPSVEAME